MLAAIVGLALGFAPNALVSALTIASALSVIEYTPELIAKQDFYKGDVVISNGGVANIFSGLDLAANAETQAIRQFVNHKNLKTIYTVCEVSYRLIASKKNGITSLQDLKGKRIGTMPSTSAAFFVERMMKSVGLQPSDYTVVSGNPCSAEPCAGNSLPALLRGGRIDAVGMWEPTIQLVLNELGDDAVTFQNRSAYREIYNLHSTEEKLRDPATRKNIVEFIRALNKAEALFAGTPEAVLPRVSAAVNISAPVLRQVWPVHDWSGPKGLPKDLLDVIVEEDEFLARADRRSPMSREVLAGMIDDSVYKEAMAA
jgi:hypothetical protein